MDERAALHALIDELPDDEVADLLDYVNNLLDPDELTEEELAEHEQIRRDMAAGNYVTWDEVKAKYLS
jgi:hypothetical protein